MKTLERWGLYRDGVNPVARTNVCPVYGTPESRRCARSRTPCRRDRERGGFISSGGAEAKERGQTTYAGNIVREGETSPDALREKARFVIAEMESRITALGYGWPDATSTQVYTVHDIGALVGDELAATGVAPDGFSWHFARPPVVGIEFEMDVRGPAREVSL